MGKYFSDAVETALQYIFYDNRTRTSRGQEGLKLLMAASEAGDADADCILARCLSGVQYVWSGHQFPEDDEKVNFLTKRSVIGGSAIGVLMAKRNGNLKGALVRQMPLSLRDAYHIVLEKAAAGDAYCQYAIGCTYYWWDFLSIQDKGREDFPSTKAYHDYIKENISQCEDWFWKSFRGGMYMAGNNLYHYYTKGDEDYVAPQPEKAATIFQTGAEMGYPIHQFFYAQDLEEAGRKAEAVEWYRRAAEGGQLGLWYKLGRFYMDGDGVPQDPVQAAYCYERSAAEGEVGGVNLLGDAYYFGRGVPKDPAKAFALYRRAYEEMENSYGVDHLARCYLEGWGTVPDYAKAYALAWEFKGEPVCQYILGRIYCEGLGMPKDIAKGVDFFRRAAKDAPEAAEELKNYKKTLFGKWKRR
ncbi:MAG: sel1 repeat family protein [Lachnospiraceae bacterium]|nr:sel1 repeat family protein [Lachnospiraceae bacterium]